MSPRKSIALEDSPRYPTKPNTTAIHLHPTGKKPAQRTAGLQSAKVIGVTAQWLSKQAKSASSSSSSPPRQLYDGAELTQHTSRPGAMDAFALPSRMFNTLRYRDGTTKEAKP